MDFFFNIYLILNKLFIYIYFIYVLFDMFGEIIGILKMIILYY